MTSHELARILLQTPDKPISLHVYDYYYTPDRDQRAMGPIQIIHGSPPNTGGYEAVIIGSRQWREPEPGGDGARIIWDYSPEVTS